MDHLLICGRRIGLRLFLAVLTALVVTNAGACKTAQKRAASTHLASAVAGDTFKDNFEESFEFIDYFDMVVAMVSNNPTPWTRYDNDARFRVPMITKWRQAKQLLPQGQVLTKELILNVFRVLREKQDGTFRTEPVVAGGDYVLPEYAGQQGFFAATPAQVAALQENPYLVTTVAKTAKAASAGTVFARYEYPGVSTWSRFKDRLSPGLIAKLTAITPNQAASSPEGDKLTALIIDELVTELISNSKGYTAAQTSQYFISIHPFDDTNGRTARIVYYFLNHGRALFLRNFDVDTFSTVSQFSALVVEGNSQWDAIKAEFDNEFIRARTAGQMPDYYQKDAPWLVAVDRLDLVSKNCSRRGELVGEAKALFNGVPIKQSIDHKDFIVLEQQLRRTFAPAEYNCP